MRDAASGGGRSLYPAVEHQDVLGVCLQPVVHQRAHPEDLAQARGQRVQPARVHNLPESHTLQQRLTSGSASEVRSLPGGPDGPGMCASVRG